MTNADNPVHASTAAIDAALMAGERSADMATVEAPVSPVDASDVAGVGEGTDAVSRAEYDALAAQFEQYRLHLLTVAEKYTSRHGWCAQVKKAISEIDPVAKMPTYSATGEVTLTLRVEIKNYGMPVSSAAVWSAFAALMAELAIMDGAADRVSAVRYGTVTGTDSLVITRPDNVGLPPYVSPQEWKERNAGDYGTCIDCGTGLGASRGCPNASCDLYVMGS